MVGLEAAMLASAAVAFTLFLWLLLYGRDTSRVDFARYADDQGWNHRHDAPLHLAQAAPQVDAAVPGDAVYGPYFAGPSGAGPFQVMGISSRRVHARFERTGPHAPRTLVHIRTAASSPGLRFAPRTDGATDDDAMMEAVGHRRWNDAFMIAAADARFVAKALDYETCALILQPPAGVTCSWEGHDLYVMFPLRPRTMAGYETLLRYSVALARRLQRHEGRSLPLEVRPAAASVPHAAPSLDGLAA